MTFGEILDRIANLRVAVVGDLMLDEYLDGEVNRISPEAPVMVVSKTKLTSMPGGAANVARNVAALGAKVSVLGPVGIDPAAEDLKGHLEGIPGCTPILCPDATRPTTKKTRIRGGGGHQILRIDSETTDPLSGEAEEALAAALAHHTEGADLLIFSDYTKGALTERVIESSRAKWSSVNAKPSTVARYRSVSMISLNRSELTQYIGSDPKDLEGALKLAEETRLRAGVGCVVATMGDQGLSAAWEGGGCMIPAPKVEVSDVTGAGDTVIATASLGMAACGFCKEVFELAVRASSVVVTHAGVAALTQTEIQAIRDLQPPKA